MHVCVCSFSLCAFIHILLGHGRSNDQSPIKHTHKHIFAYLITHTHAHKLWHAAVLYLGIIRQRESFTLLHLNRSEIFLTASVRKAKVNWRYSTRQKQRRDPLKKKKSVRRSKKSAIFFSSVCTCWCSRPTFQTVVGKRGGMCIHTVLVNNLFWSTRVYF